MSSFLFGILPLSIFSAETQAQDITYDFGGRAVLQSIFEDSRDLGVRDTNPTKTQAIDIQPDLKIKIGQNFEAYVEGRLVRTIGDAGIQDDTGQIAASQKFAELREIWVKAKNLAGIIPLSLTVGHQRIRDSRSLWWNDDLDAVKLSYDSTLFNGFIGVVNNFAAYRTSGEDYEENEKERLRILAEASWLYRPDHRFELRALYENDYSGLENIGQLVLTNDRDTLDYKTTWIGARSLGSFNPETTLISALRYRGDILTVIGSEDILNTASTANAAQRRVTGYTTRDVFGWALDLGVDMDLDITLNPTVSFNYAYGSGDDDSTDGTNNAYRDTDLNGNTSRYGLSSQSLHNYGEAFRPELSNLHILSAGIGIPLLKATDTSIFYRYYRQDEKATSLGSTRIQNSVNNLSADVGQEIDFSFNMNLEKELEHKINLPKNTTFRLASGFFLPGKAYEDLNASEGPLVRVLAELKFKF